MLNLSCLRYGCQHCTLAVAQHCHLVHEDVHLNEHLIFTIYGRKQARMYVNTLLQCSLASVGLAQARPNKFALLACNCWQPTCKAQYKYHSNLIFSLFSSLWQIRLWFASCPARNCDHRPSQCSEVGVTTCMEPFTWIQANCMWAQAQVWHGWPNIRTNLESPAINLHTAIWIVLSPGPLFVMSLFCYALIYEQNTRHRFRL